MESFSTELPIAAGNVTLIPVVRSCFNVSQSKTRTSITAGKEPIAIIVCDTNGLGAFDMSSAVIPLDSLVKIIPDLNATLIPFRQEHDN